ncbi:hypothetical protein PI860_22255 (plasmid) [Aeromonas salmonicida subsp. salmonicida]|uniref:hypothetical protein n=1 Tax=Aeromonas salmonicida TaxID=645 RepID=UPI0023002561|nr:hypothetical protein [Aeromonas salmonicida]WCB52524.1 hypothetical protein PI860_22255 [Aeromonas salmonicida subsp. salmonicida]
MSLAVENSAAPAWVFFLVGQQARCAADVGHAITGHHDQVGINIADRQIQVSTWRKGQGNRGGGHGGGGDGEHQEREPIAMDETAYGLSFVTSQNLTMLVTSVFHRRSGLNSLLFQTGVCHYQSRF